jgi:hypothetical protein
LRPWRNFTLTSKVYEVIVSLTRGGDRPITEEDVKAELEMRYGYRMSEADLAKSFLVLETLGKITTSTSGTGSLIIRLARRGRSAG